MNQDQIWSTASAACTDALCEDLFKFSSTCWYFGESLAEKLGAGAEEAPPPIGLINTAWGGSMIEEWTTEAVTATCQGMKSPTPGFTQGFYDTRVTPYLDMTVKGWVWCKIIPSTGSRS